MKKKIPILVRSETEILLLAEIEDVEDELLEFDAIRSGRLYQYAIRVHIRDFLQRTMVGQVERGRAEAENILFKDDIDFSEIAYLLRKSRVNRWLAIEPAQNSRLKSKITQVSQSREKGDAAQTLSNDFHGSRKLIKSLENSWLIDFYENKKR